MTVTPLLDHSSLAHLTLHSAGDGPAFAGNTLLTSLQLPIASYEQPLIIKSKNDVGQGIVHCLTVGLVDTEQSSSSMLQIEDKISKLQESNSKLQETVSTYIQKAETIQISKLTIDKLEKDGFTIIAKSVPSINDSDYQIPNRFHNFQWPVKNNEKDKKNKDAYLEYLTAFTESFDLLQVKNAIESPHLNTVQISWCWAASFELRGWFVCDALILPYDFQKPVVYGFWNEAYQTT